MTLALFGCAHDVVLPDVQQDAVCGNGVVEPGEECDLQSGGCVACDIVPGWTCTKNACAVVCGDGVSGDGPACQNPRKDGAACDMSGYWVSRETDFSRDVVVNAIQVTSTWVLYRFSQSGDAFQVEEILNCGSHVSGSANVDFTPGSLRAVMLANRMDPAGKHGPRKGTFRASGSGCAFTYDRFYTVRGVTEDFLPVDFAQKPDLNQLSKLPFEDDPVNPKGTNLTGAVDVAGDGYVGVSVRVSGLASGLRHAAERDWKEYASTKSIAPNAVDFAVPGTWDLQENVLRVSECGGACALVAAGAFASKDVPSRVTFHFLGHTLGSPRVSAVLKGKPRDSLDVDLSSCANARLTLVHDTLQAPP